MPYKTTNRKYCVKRKRLLASKIKMTFCQCWKTLNDRWYYFSTCTKWFLVHLWAKSIWQRIMRLCCRGSTIHIDTCIASFLNNDNWWGSNMNPAVTRFRQTSIWPKIIFESDLLCNIYITIQNFRFKLYVMLSSSTLKYLLFLVANFSLVGFVK